MKAVSDFFARETDYPDFDGEGARFGVGPLPPFAGFLALKKPRMSRHMAHKEYFQNR